MRRERNKLEEAASRYIAASDRVLDMEARYPDIVKRVPVNSAHIKKVRGIVVDLLMALKEGQQ